MNNALKHFKKRDFILYEVAKTIKLTNLPKSEDSFLDLIETIISQQLSIKAADTIFKRFQKIFPRGKITPAYLLKIPDENLRKCGISYSKVTYIKGVSQAVLDKKLNLKKIEKLGDEEVISELIKLKGIGIWTAEMYLMFILRRPDVFSAGDMGLQNAMIKLYGLNKKPKNEKLIDISLNWSPYRTTASRILWKLKDSGN